MSEITYGRSPEEINEDRDLGLFEAWDSLGYAKKSIREPDWVNACQRGIWYSEANALQKAANSLRPRDPRYWAQQLEYQRMARRVHKILVAC